MERQTAFLIFIVFSLLIFCSPAYSETQQQQHSTVSLELITKQWKGDLDGMMQRRLIRVLVPYSKTHYFIDKDTQRGIAYDVMKEFEKVLNAKKKTGKLSVHVVFIPTSRDEMFTGLLEGKGDVSIGLLTITPSRLETVDFTNPLSSDGSEILVTGPGAPAIATIDDLAGKQVYVRKSSSFYESLSELNEKFKKDGKKEVVIKTLPENLETEDILEMTNAGLVPLTVADKMLADFWKQVLENLTVHPSIALRSGASYGWAIRKDSPLLKAELNDFLKTHGSRTAFGNIAFRKYLKSLKYVKSATSQEEMKKFNSMVKMFQGYADQYKVDWLLMAAQGYQESRLDQSVRSPVGAIGVMQIMPATGKDLNVGDISTLEPNIHAGIKYMRFMINTYYKDDPMDDLNKMLMTFASYNAGPNRIKRLRKETEARGLDPNVWFGNVERIVSEKVGQETVTYVSNIYKYFVAYKLSIEQALEQKAAQESLQK